jgi:4-hydroxy-tetrahydrodipicolinate synthase
VPYYNKPMQSGIHAHFQAVSLSTGLPVILHDIPARTMRELADETLARLCQSNRFAGLLDGSGEVTRPTRLSALVPPGFRFLSGDDATALAYIAAGGDGCISTISNVTPDMCRAILPACVRRDCHPPAIWSGAC